MAEGWWTSYAFAGLWLSFGGLVYMLWRDHNRRKRLRQARQTPVRLVNPDAPTVEDLEKQFGKKG